MLADEIVWNRRTQSPDLYYLGSEPSSATYQSCNPKKAIVLRSWCYLLKQTLINRANKMARGLENVSQKTVEQISNI